MPTVTLNKEVFEKLVGKKLPLDKLKDRISMIGTDLEKIENNEIVVEVFPNRPDMLSEQGFARAFSTFIGTKIGLAKYKTNKSDYKVKVDKINEKIRPYTVCAVIKNLKFDDEKIREIIQIQEKLHVTMCRKRKKGAIGIYPMESIKFPITFTSKKPKDISFQPLESNRTMNGCEILEHISAGKEFKHLLEGKDLYSIFVDANNEILSMPPIINSHKTGRVLETTKDVFIECSGFDLEPLNQCLNIIVTALSDMGGDIYEVEVIYEKGSKENKENSKEKYFTPYLEPKKWKLDIDFVNKLLGLELKDKEIKDLLEKMGYGYENGEVLVPAYRADIMHQVDFIEDIAIAYGFENFIPNIPNVSTIGEENQFEIFKRQISELLIGLNFLECETYHLSNVDNLNTKMCTNTNIIKLENSLNLDYDVLRSWLLPNLMQILKENKHYEYPQNIFNIGTVFKENRKLENGVEEYTKLALVICNLDADFTKAKQIIEYLLKCLDLKPKFVQEEHPSFIPGRCVSVKIENKIIAFVGEINPQVLSNWNIEMPCSGFEMDLRELFNTIFLK